MAPAPVTALRVLKVTQGGREHLEDLVATEEPLALTLGYSTPLGREQRELAVTMRTPGNDFELAFGFLFTEGVRPFLLRDYNKCITNKFNKWNFWCLVACNK